MNVRKETWLLIFVALVLIGGGGAAVVVINNNYSAVVNKIAQAIATAERGAAEIASGNILNNNPGDIEDSNGQLIQYATLQDGWSALLHQVNLFFSGSHIYNPSMTISQVGFLYADGAHDPVGANNWANNVSAALGVTPDTPLNQLS